MRRGCGCGEKRQGWRGSWSSTRRVSVRWRDGICVKQVPRGGATDGHRARQYSPVASAASVGPGHRCDFRGQASRSREASPERSGAVRPCNEWAGGKVPLAEGRDESVAASVDRSSAASDLYPPACQPAATDGWRMTAISRRLSLAGPPRQTAHVRVDPRGNALSYPPRFHIAAARTRAGFLDDTPERVVESGFGTTGNDDQLLRVRIHLGAALGAP